MGQLKQWGSYYEASPSQVLSHLTILYLNLSSKLSEPKLGEYWRASRTKLPSSATINSASCYSCQVLLCLASMSRRSPLQRSLYYEKMYFASILGRHLSMARCSHLVCYQSMCWNSRAQTFFSACLATLTNLSPDFSDLFWSTNCSTFVGYVRYLGAYLVKKRCLMPEQPYAHSLYLKSCDLPI